MGPSRGCRIRPQAAPPGLPRSLLPAWMLLIPATGCGKGFVSVPGSPPQGTDASPKELEERGDFFSCFPKTNSFDAVYPLRAIPLGWSKGNRWRIAQGWPWSCHETTQADKHPPWETALTFPRSTQGPKSLLHIDSSQISPIFPRLTPHRASVGRQSPSPPAPSHLAPAPKRDGAALAEQGRCSLTALGRDFASWDTASGEGRS